MLTADLVRPRLVIRGSRLSVDALDVRDSHWLQTAADLIHIYDQHYGHPRDALDEALTAYEGDRLDYTVLRGLAKVLSDAAEFNAPDFPVEPAELRAWLFGQGPAFRRADLFHPYTRDDRIRAAAETFGMPPEHVEAALFGDRPAAALMTDAGGPWQPEALLARYNLELARGVLYWARRMEVDVFSSYKDFWRYLKLFKLMFEASPLPGGGYHIVLDGPISPFVRSTTRYGRQFAAFLPALLLGERWQMEAEVRPPGVDGWLSYRLTDRDDLPSVFKSSGQFDSRMEADFAAEFHAKFGDERAKWLLSREDEVLLLGDSVFIPDFSITHKEDGRRALVEILGFWHPDYLKRKLNKVRAANRTDLILLVYEGVNLGAERLQHVPGEVLYFVRKPILKDVMAAVDRVAEPPSRE